MEIRGKQITAELDPGLDSHGVYLAEHDGIVFKTHALDESTNILRERARTVGGIKDNPNIARVRGLIGYDHVLDAAGQTEARLAIAYEYIDGPLITDLRLTPAESDEALLALAEATARLHNSGIIHGGIGKHQVRYDQESNRVVLLDAGWLWQKTGNPKNPVVDITGLRDIASALNLSAPVRRALATQSADINATVTGIREAIAETKTTVDDLKKPRYGAGPIPAPKPGKPKDASTGSTAAPPPPPRSGGPVVMGTPDADASDNDDKEATGQTTAQPEPEESKQDSARSNEQESSETGPDIGADRPGTEEAVATPAPEAPAETEDQPSTGDEKKDESPAAHQVPDPTVAQQHAPNKNDDAPAKGRPRADDTEYDDYTPEDTDHYVYVEDRQKAPEPKRERSLALQELVATPASGPETEPDSHDDGDGHENKTATDTEGSTEDPSEPETDQPEDQTTDETSASETKTPLTRRGPLADRRIRYGAIGAIAVLALGGVGVAAATSIGGQGSDQSSEASPQSRALPEDYSASSDWDVPIPDGAQVVATDAAIAILDGTKMKLYSTRDGKEIRTIDLGGNPEFVVDTTVGQDNALAWKVGKKVSAWTSKTGKKSDPIQADVDDGTKFSNTGEHLMMVKDKTVSTIGPSGKIEFPKGSGAPMAVDDAGVIEASFDDPVNIRPAKGDAKEQKMDAPHDGQKIQSWIAAGHGYGITIWAKDADSTDDDNEVTVSVNDLKSGESKGSYDTTLGKTKDWKWMTGQGGRAGTYGPLVVNLVNGKMNDKAPEDTTYKKVKGQLAITGDKPPKAYPTDGGGYELTKGSILALTSSYAIVQEGDDIKAYPSTLT